MSDPVAFPAGEAALRTIAMPADANPNGDIFGGWLLSQMDLAGSVLAKESAVGRVATVGIEAMKFHKPVMIGDEVSCYCRVLRIGNTSVTVHIESWVRRSIGRERHKVTEGVFTYVALDDHRRPRPIAQI
ncbi:MAG: hotdog domain-containing protein [Aliidongia sp.]